MKNQKNNGINKKIKVIIDCDTGIDDSLALMYIFKSNKFDVLGISTITGNVNSRMAAKNTYGILKKLNRLDIPIVIGNEYPWQKNYIVADETHGVDGLGLSFISQEAITDGIKFSSDYLKFYETEFKKASKEGYKITLLCLGPLTNLKNLLDTYPHYITCIDKIISMGGSYKSHGNCSPVAEYNYWWDPHSASYVYSKLSQFNSKTPLITMIPLDLTRDLVLTPNYIQLMKFLNDTMGSLVERVTKFYIDFHWEYEKIIGCVINDIAVPISLTRPELFKGFDSYVAVETRGESIGQTIVDRYSFWKKENNATILNKSNSREVLLEFISTVTETNKKITKKYL